MVNNNNKFINKAHRFNYIYLLQQKIRFCSLSLKRERERESEYSEKDSFERSNLSFGLCFPDAISRALFHWFYRSYLKCLHYVTTCGGDNRGLFLFGVDYFISSLFHHKPSIPMIFLLFFFCCIIIISFHLFSFHSLSFSLVIIKSSLIVPNRRRGYY